MVRAGAGVRAGVARGSRGRGTGRGTGQGSRVEDEPWHASQYTRTVACQYAPRVWVVEEHSSIVGSAASLAASSASAVPELACAFRGAVQ